MGIWRNDVLINYPANRPCFSQSRIFFLILQTPSFVNPSVLFLYYSYKIYENYYLIVAIVIINLVFSSFFLKKKVLKSFLHNNANYIIFVKIIFKELLSYNL